jgi:hypothetical protein
VAVVVVETLAQFLVHLPLVVLVVGQESRGLFLGPQGILQT